MKGISEKLIDVLTKDYGEIATDYIDAVKKAQIKIREKVLRLANKYDSYIDYDKCDDYFFTKYGDGCTLRKDLHYSEKEVKTIEENGITIRIIKCWVETKNDEEVVEAKFSVIVTFINYKENDK